MLATRCPGRPELRARAGHEPIEAHAALLHPSEVAQVEDPRAFPWRELEHAPERDLEQRVIMALFIKTINSLRCFYELATRSRISSFPGEIYQVPIDAIRLLEDQQIGYRRATDAEVKAAHDQVRNPTPAVL